MFTMPYILTFDILALAVFSILKCHYILFTIMNMTLKFVDIICINLQVLGHFLMRKFIFIILKHQLDEFPVIKCFLWEQSDWPFHSMERFCNNILSYGYNQNNWNY